MLSFSSFIIAAIAVIGALAAPSELIHRQNQTITTPQTGVHDGWYYNFWTDGASPIQFTLGPGGSYSVRWSSGGHWIGGKGWQVGSTNRCDCDCLL
jgi:endo-1,4-beta-xylanase